MKEEEKKNGIVIKESTDIFERFDKLDDEIIIAEIEKRVVDTWVYFFKQDSHEVWGLAKVGIDECTNELAKKGIALRDEDVSCEIDPTNPEFVLFKAKVIKVLIDKDGKEAHVEAAIGTKRQWIMLRRKSDGKFMENKFWFEQGSQKALRNARSRLIPEDIKAKVIANAKKLKKVKEVGPAREEEKKSIEKTRPEKTEETAKPPEETKGSFPEEEKEVKTQGEGRKAGQEVMFNIVRLQATLVDKYRIDPGAIMEKLEEKFKISDLTNLSELLAQEILVYLKKTIEHNEKRWDGK